MALVAPARVAPLHLWTPPEFWINLQASYELDVARQKADVVNSIEKIEPYQVNATAG